MYTLYSSAAANALSPRADEQGGGLRADGGVAAVSASQTTARPLPVSATTTLPSYTERSLAPAPRRFSLSE